MTEDARDTWLPVIGSSLALLCLNQVEAQAPERVDSVVKKVLFLEGLGVPRAYAAAAVGSSAESVRVMIAQAGRKRGKKRSKA
jgi:hypothetical protein